MTLARIICFDSFISIQYTILDCNKQSMKSLYLRMPFIFILEYIGRRAPRSARRARKPLQEDWIKGPRRGIWLKCTYSKCSFEWQYFGGHKWAECPICHSGMKVSLAKKNFMENKERKNTRI